LPAAAIVPGVGFVGPALLGVVWLPAVVAVGLVVPALPVGVMCPAVVGVGFVVAGLPVGAAWPASFGGVAFVASERPAVPALPCAAPVLLRGAELAGAGFGVPVVPDCLASLPEVPPAPGCGFGDGGLPEAAGVAGFELSDAAAPPPGRLDALVTVLREPGPGVTVLCVAVPDRLTPGPLPVPGCAGSGLFIAGLFMAGLPAAGCDVAGPGVSNSVGSDRAGPVFAALESAVFIAAVPVFAGPDFGA
jgi:hypothetical protein